jgi:SAM-dependent methyltransferase
MRTYASAELARSFGDAAEDYERGRPGWPEEAIDHLAVALGLSSDATVLDLGAGTGKLTRTLLERFGRVLAVEPLESLRRLLETRAPRAHLLAGTAERIPLPDESVDAVFVGEAFHWFEGERTLAEIARVLRGPRGLALLWNVPEGTEPPLPVEVARLHERLRAQTKPPRARYGSNEWKRAFAGAPFEDLREARFVHGVELDREGLLANAASQSYVAVLPEERRTVVLGELRRWIPDGLFRVSFRTDAYWTRRLP